MQLTNNNGTVRMKIYIVVESIECVCNYMHVFSLMYRSCNCKAIVIWNMLLCRCGSKFHIYNAKKYREFSYNLLHGY